MSSRVRTDDAGVFHLERRPGDTESVLRVLEGIERAVREGRRYPPSDAALAGFIDAARRDDGRPSQAMMVRLQILAQQCALERADRLDLAHVMLRREVRSWSEVTLGEAQTLMAALEGFAYIAHLQAEQGRRWRYGKCPAVPCPMRSPESSAAVLTDTPVKGPKKPVDGPPKGAYTEVMTTAVAPDPTTMQPAEIDAVLADQWYIEQKAKDTAVSYTRLLAENRGLTYQQDGYREQVAKAEAEFAQARQIAGPLEAEFKARGGWQRYFLVAGGHVHRGMNCSTCYPTTTYGWLTDLSDCDEKVMVAEYGELACTVCPLCMGTLRPAALARGRLRAAEGRLKALARSKTGLLMGPSPR